MISTKDPFDHAEWGDADYFEGVDLEVIQEARDPGSVSVLNRAAVQAWNGNEKIIKFLLTAAAGGAEIVDDKALMMVNVSHETALHYAARSGQLRSVKALIEADRSNKLLRSLCKNNRTAMHWAVENGQTEIVEMLVEADPDFQYSADKDGKTPLLIALEEAISGDKKAAEIRKLLIEKQPDQCRLHTGTKKWTYIHHATYKGDLDAIKEIIHFRADCFDLVDTEMQSFFHLAAKFDQVNVVRYILDLKILAGSILNGKDIFGNTPLHLAISNGHYGIALSMLGDPRVDKMIENVDGKKALDLASSVFLGNLIKDKHPIQFARKGDLDFLSAIQVDVLQNSTDEEGESVLFSAVRNGHLNCCEVISERCPNLLYQTNKNGESVLHIASSNGKDEIIKFFLGKVDYKPLMMVSDDQKTALHFAVDRGHFESAKLLILADSSNKLLRMTDCDKETAMHYAVRRHNLDIVKLLIEANTNFEYSADNSGNTPHSIALQEASSMDHKTVEIRKLLIQKLPEQCKVRIGTNGWTLLHHATVKGDSNAIKEIIQFCPDCSELVDNEERNFLHLASTFEHEHVGSENTTKLLLYDSRVNKIIENKEGKNALDAIRFKYDKRKAGVLGFTSGVDEEDLKDRSSFDLVVGALISAASFTAGITVPGGFISDGRSKGTAILLKKATFVAFVAADTTALALSLLAVFIHFA